MAGRAGVSTVMASVVEVCHRGYEPERLKAAVMQRLQRLIPVDALWWATSDPATVLFTQAYREGIPDRLIPAFIENEFMGHDVNSWVELAADPLGVRTMLMATEGELGLSSRFRELLQPIGLGDELRAVLRTGESCWGLMCLHRELGRTFTVREQQLIRALAPHLAEGLRAGLLMSGTVGADETDAPGLVVLDPSGELVSATAAARAWFAELGSSGDGDQVPAEVMTAAALLTSPNVTAADLAGPVPRMRCRTTAGRWVVLHASWLDQRPPGERQVAIIIEPASSIEVAAVIMAAYGLSDRERAVTGLVCNGKSTAQIAIELRISTNTVQDHLKAVFDKTGVRTRGEVRTRILRDHYLPALHRGLPVRPSGFFDSGNSSPLMER
jgi:DNA-binding CsgD family transcriptional regulator